MSRQFAFKVCSHCFHFRLDKRSVWWYIDIVFVDVISISQQLQRNTNTTTNPCWWSTVDWIMDHVWSLQTITIGVLRLYGWWTQCHRIYEFPQELPSVCVAQLKATFPKAKAPCSEVILPRVLEGGGIFPSTVGVLSTGSIAWPSSTLWSSPHHSAKSPSPTVSSLTNKEGIYWIGRETTFLRMGPLLRTGIRFSAWVNMIRIERERHARPWLKTEKLVVTT